MMRPTRTTIVFALTGGFIVVPAAVMLSPYLHWGMAFKLALWAYLAAYAVLLARWSRTHLLSVLFPLLVLLGTAFWPQTYAGFLFLSVGVLSWIRSGICFQGTPARTLAAEVVTVLGGSSLVMLFGGQSTVSWAIAICLFALVQALYFFMVPHQRAAISKNKTAVDAFEKAVQEAHKVLDGY